MIAALTLSVSLLTAPAIAQGPPPSPPPSAKVARTAAPNPTDVALAKAKEVNERVEVEALRSATATYYANPDGKTLRAELSSVPIRVKTDDGWRPIDLTLVEKDGALRPKTAPGDLVLSRGNDSTVATFSGEKGRMAFASPSTLPKPTVKGNVATYPSAYGPGIDLVVSVMPSGFRHDVVIRQRPTNALELRVPMRLSSGTKLGIGADKTPGLLNATGEEAADLAAAPVIDAAAMRDPDKGNISQAKAKIDGNNVIYTAPATFLNDPTTTYPVTVTTASETWEGTGIAGDTHVSNVLPDGSANATLPWLLAGKSHSGSRTHRTYIMFHISGTPLEGGTVHNADLRLHNQDSHTCSDTDSPGIDLQRVTSPWNTGTISWNNQPSTVLSGHVANRGAYSATRCPEGEGELYYSIELIVQAWMNGTPDLGVRLNSVIEPDSTQNWRYYRSHEYGGYDTYPFTPRGPVLFIQYTPADRPVSAVAWRYTEPEASTYDEIEALANDPARARATQSVGPDPVGPSWEEAQQAKESGSEFDIQDAEQQTPLPHESDPPVEPEPDTTLPTVVETSPARDATGVPIITTIRATFGEAVRGSDIQVKKQDGGAVAGTPVYANRTLTFTPSAPLAADTRYTVEVTKATDYADNVMAPHSWAFTTANASLEGLVAAFGLEEGTGSTVADASGNNNSGVAQSTTW
ncbi:DNRLRE domain-containing protein, partial [Nonomuraea sp. NPDC059007]